jgi:hypothetical protein
MMWNLAPEKRGIWYVVLAGAVVIVSGWLSPAYAVSTYLEAFRGQYPASVGTRIDACSLCHTAIPQRNPYGAAFQNAGFDFVPIEADAVDQCAVVIGERPAR